MCRRSMKVILLLLGSVLLFFAAFPILAFIRFEDSLQTELVALKLVMMPVGAICLVGATMLSKQRARH